MKLVNVIKEKQEWLNKGYEVFAYDRDKMISETRENPTWIHFGSGNLFRAFEAVFADKLLDKGITDKGIIVVSGRKGADIDTYYRANDNLHVAVTLKSDGSVNKRVVGSIAESVRIDETERLKQILVLVLLLLMVVS